jgi:CMP-N-acetylneuraminic acid synthetase
MKILITICARGGSKGIPNKNIKDLNGKPLISYTIDFAQKFSSTHPCDIVLSTDSDDIRAVAEKSGLFTNYRRSTVLASDSAGKIDVINDILLFQEEQTGKEYDYIIDLDITSPLRTQDDLIFAIEKIQANDKALNIFSVSPANRNPYFNMVEKNINGFFNLVKKSDSIKSRQEAPEVYDMNASFYIFRRTFFKEGCKTTTTERSLAYIMPHLCFDLDHLHDFKIMEVLLKEKLIDFSI